MVIILLFLAFIAYVGLYFLWQAAQPYTHAAPPPVAQTLLESLLMPHSTVFMVLRGLILITMLYVIGDAIMSWGKRRRRAKREMIANQAAPRQS